MFPCPAKKKAEKWLDRLMSLSFKLTGKPVSAGAGVSDIGVFEQEVLHKLSKYIQLIQKTPRPQISAYQHRSATHITYRKCAYFDRLSMNVANFRHC